MRAVAVAALGSGDGVSVVFAEGAVDKEGVGHVRTNVIRDGAGHTWRALSILRLYNENRVRNIGI